MLKDIQPYKQEFSHSCLVADFLMLLNKKYDIKFNKKDEGEILLKGMDKKYPFYVVGIPKEINNKYKQPINIIVDNKYFTDTLIKSFNDKTNFNIICKQITTQLIRDLLKEHPLICHIDDNYLGDYSHASHFIVLESAIDKKISIVDPIDGKRKLMSDKDLRDSIFSLKTHIKMCPLLFYFDR
jgi:hypothetical protein